MSSKSTKLRAQVKSRWYYFFWSSATVSVLLGQLYVGSGYRLYSRTLMQLFDAVEFEVKKPGFDAPDMLPSPYQYLN